MSNRGRPPGVKNGEGKGLAPIKNWKSRHTTVIALSVLGESNEAIAEKTGYTPQRVSQILNDPKGLELREEMEQRFRENLTEDVASRLERLAVKAVDALEETLSANISAIHKAKPNQDRVALKILEGQGHLRSEGTPGSGGIQLPPEMAGAFLKAIERANRVQEINALPQLEAEVTDG